MNTIFGILILLSMIFLFFSSPDSLLSAMINGGEKALSLTLKLAVIYAVWLGVSAIAEKTNLTKKTAKILRPINKFLFGDISPISNDYISMNLASNLLGFSGATTPFGIKSIDQLSIEKKDYAIAMFFVINATSIQLIPSSVLSLRSSMNSSSPSSIILPTILATTLSSVVGILLVKVFIKKK